MSEVINDRKVFSLFEVTRSIQKTLTNRYQSAYWIKAEMNKLNHYDQSGHCYPELVEKREGKVIAQIKCTLWKNDYEKINTTFQKVLKEPLKDGIKILIHAKIGFHPEHGLALRILDIDPAFTLGDLEKEKQETIQRLQHEGIFLKNKSLKLSTLPQRIAIISVRSSKGYADFTKVLDSAGHSWGYAIFHCLFPSLLQGDNAVVSLIRQLRQIKKVIRHFDAVAIIRGGGGDIGLSCYNHYNLAREIALFPLPVFTGIGHSTNETVAEMIAFENAITPTKLAESLIQQFHNFSVPLQKAEERIVDRATALLRDERSKFLSEVKIFRSATENRIMRNQNNVGGLVQSLVQNSDFRIKNEKEWVSSSGENFRRVAITLCTIREDSLRHPATDLNRGVQALLRENRLLLDNAEQQLEMLSPKNVMKRGYSITSLNGKAIRSHMEIKKGDILKTRIYEGEIDSEVLKSKKSSKS